MSDFIHCDRAVFAYVCSFLEFHDKLPRLLPTCRTIAPPSAGQSSSKTDGPQSFSYETLPIGSSLFDVSTCCREDILVIGLNMGRSSDSTDRLLQQSKLARLMRHVVVSVDWFAKFEPEIASTCIENLAANDDLESLCIYDDRDVTELTDRPSTLIALYLRDVKLNGKPRKLRKLHWVDFGQPWSGPNSIDWSVLELLSHLEDIDCSLPITDGEGNSEERVHKLHGMLRNLPDSLRHVSLRVGRLESDERFDWNVAFQSPTFLPRLETFQYEDTAGLNLGSLETTVIQATGQLRPIRMLKLCRLDQQSFHNLDDLTMLVVQCSQGLACPVLDDTAMLNLQMFCFNYMGDQPMTSLDSYFIFLSCRRVEWLDLRNCGSLHTAAGVRALASMRHLRYLRIYDTEEDFPSPLFGENISDEQLENLLPSNSLPNLRHLSGNLGKRGLESLLRAASGLRQVISLQNDDPEMLVTIGRCCPLIESLVMTGTAICEAGIFGSLCATTYETMANCLNGLQRSDNMFTHLVHLHLAGWPSDGLTTPAFRLLMNEFKHAPLQVFKPPRLITSMYTLASYFMVRDLPLVREFHGNEQSDVMKLYKSHRSLSSGESQDDCKQPHVDCQREFEYVERVYVGARNWHHRPAATYESVLSELTSLSKPLDVEKLNFQKHFYFDNSTYMSVPSARDCCHFRFRSSQDDQGLSGREAFLMSLHAALSENEKALLENCVADDEVNHTGLKTLLSVMNARLNLEDSGSEDAPVAAQSCLQQ